MARVPGSTTWLMLLINLCHSGSLLSVAAVEAHRGATLRLAMFSLPSTLNAAVLASNTANANEIQIFFMIYDLSTVPSHYNCPSFPFKCIVASEAHA